jgi:hypothetical protein
MTEMPVAAPPPDDGVRHYTFLSLTALGAITLALFWRGLDALSLLPALVGALAVLFRWRGGAVWVLLVVVYLLAAQRWPVLHPAFISQEIAWLIYPVGLGQRPRLHLRPALIGPSSEFGLPDLLLGAGLFAYLAGYYRLLGVAANIFPADPRRRGQRDLATERRPPRLVMGREILTLLAAWPLWIGLTWLCWRWLENKETTLDIADYSWQAMVLAWLIGLLFLVASALVRHGAQRKMRPEEAALFLQDTLWLETSREQRRINRWIAWARRRQRGKEKL